MFVIILTIGFERSIQVDVDDNCHEEMTGKRGGEYHRMNSA